MATRHTRLVRRGAVYYFRCKIPVDLIAHYGKQEILESLRTKDEREALRLVVARSEKQEQEFERIRAGRTITELSEEQIGALSAQWVADVLAEDEEHRINGRMWPSIIDEDTRYLDELEAAYRKCLAHGQFILIERRADEVLHKAGITLDKKGDSYRRLCFRILKTSIGLVNSLQARNRGDVVETPRAPATIFAKPQAARVGSGATLHELLPRWEREREPTPRARQEWGLVVRRFNALHGELPVDLVEKKHVIAYKDKMLEDHAATATISKHLGALSSLLQLAVDNDLCPANVARGIRVRGRKVPEESRLPYDIADLKQIFSSRVYTDPSYRPVGGAAEAAFWLPLLGLWTGCRLEELGQALVVDVQAADGVHYLNISDLGEGKSVKTAGSRRPVPIHLELVRLGFLRYVEERRKQGDVRVFPLLKKNSYGRWTQAWSKWWRYYARGTVGIADTRKVFHSFRHTFIRQCRASGIEEEQRIAITGHAGGTVGRAYGGAYPLPALAEAMKKLRYAGLDLSAVKAVAALA